MSIAGYTKEMDGTYLSAIIANVNVKSSEPATSIGAGEVIYRSDLSKLQVNTGTDTSPVWVEVGTGGGLGTDELTFTIDKDNISGTPATYPELRMNRGYSDAYAFLRWTESSTYFTFGRVNHEDATAYLGHIAVSKIYVGADGAYIQSDGTGNLVFHVPTGKGIIFERDP